MYDIQSERASGKKSLSRFPLLLPPFELCGMASGGASSEFEVEEGIEKAAVMHDPLSIFWCGFQETRLAAHDFGNVMGDGFRDTDTIQLADMAVGGFLQCFGMLQTFACSDLCGDPFVIFAEDKRKKQGRVYSEPGGAPAVNLSEALFKPVGFSFAIRRVEPGTKLGEKVFKYIEFATEGEYLLGLSATEKLLYFFIKTR